MAPSRLPEMLRGPLQEICLQLRLAPLLQDMPLRAAFEKALTPPPEAAVAAAITGLQRTAALDEHEQLTPLGRHLAALPVDIGVGRLILYGSLFRCAQPILLIAAALSDRSPFLSPMHKRDEARAVQSTFNVHQSDHLAVLEAHQRWEKEVKQNGKGAGYRFCERHFLSERTLQGMSDMAGQFWDNLVSLGMLPNLKALPYSERDQAREGANRYSDNTELLKAVLCAGLFPNVVKATNPSTNNSSSGGPFGSNKGGGLQLHQGRQSLSIHPSSFNRDQRRVDSGWLVYHEKVCVAQRRRRSLTSHTSHLSHSLLPLPKPQVATGKIYIHDCSPVTALALFLFGAEPQVFHAQHRVVIDTWIDLRISPRTAVLFKALRKQLFELLESKIANLPANAVQQMEEMAEGGGGGGGGAMSASPADVRSSASGDVRNEGKAVERPPEKKSVVVVGSKAPVPGQAGWPPELESKEAAQEAILTGLVYLIGKGMELQADELAAAALQGGKKPVPGRR